MRDRVLLVVITALFLLLLSGLFYTQIIRFTYYSRLSRNNSIRIIPISGPRGNIYDRNGRIVVTNRLSFDIAIIYRELDNRTALVQLLSATLGMSGKQIAAALEKSRAKPYAPVTIAEDIGKDKAIRLEEASFDVGGMIVQTRSRRDYPYKDAGCHVFGYLGEVTEEEIENLKDYGYRMKDMIGRGGVEKYYDPYLAGVDGGTQVEVDSRGRQTQVLGVKEPESGKDLYLTVDIALQSECDKLLGEHRGAVIVMDPNTGEVLALASHPPFDPNVFVKPDESKARVALIKDRAGRPLSNRAISGLYPPGSVFKIVTASAGLETKKITPWSYFNCAGSYKLGRGRFDCWKEEGHGSQNLRGGLKHSCNVFFYNTGRLAGVDAMEYYAKLFGYGAHTGIDLPDEVKGIVPGRQWKLFRKKDNWYEGETLNYAIGQGYLAVTPIQVVDMMCAMANKTGPVKPYLAKRINKTDISPSKPKNINLRPENIKNIREGLFDVVNAEDGTGKHSRAEDIIAAGKTGTAQNPHGKTHAWFTGFAPYENAKICVIVFLEHGGKGGLEPAGIARGIFQEAKKLGYF
jgi:penicillin-binding protein 2